MMVLLVLVALGLLAWLLAYRRQVKQLHINLEQILSQEPTNQLLNQELTSKEVTLLVSSINQLLLSSRKKQQHLQAIEQTNQESLTHLAHDLRTPLAALEGYLHLLESSNNEADEARYHTIMAERLKHTRHLMDQYFLSLKYDRELLEIPRQPIDPDEMLLQHLLTYSTEYDRLQLEPVVSLIEGQSISAQPDLYGRLCQNLIQNTIVHGKDYVEFHSTADDTWYQLSIRNGRRHTEPLDASRLFERFYKGETDKGQESTGLGLSIVKGLTHQLGGTVVITVTDNEFLITLRFPLKTK